MSSRSKYVQINRTLIVLDPQSMPVNLGHSTREDAPEQAFPALAYDGANVLPTALGYTSYFGENTRLNIGDSLKNLQVQHVFQYQSVNMRTLSIALCETGIYVAGATTGTGSFGWQQVVDYSATFVEGVRRLWTFCVISNRLYMYQQGQAEFYGLVNPAEYQETTIPEVIKDASITQAWYHELSQTGLLKYKPNFINMEGQLGLFKGGNRLGFWDSDGAVAWSSATQVYDFVPSTTTFAGITKFTDVVGRITLIKQHGSGFIIYATRSVVVVTAISGSPEKWAGRAIFSDVGVVFDSQVAMAQPDSEHYAITSAGLCRITNGSPEILEPEVMDYVRNNNDIYAVSFVDSRYIFIHVTNDFDSAVPEIEAVELKDAFGNSYKFPLPETVPAEEFADYVSGVLSSKNPLYQADFSEVQEPIEPLDTPKKGEALLPCWIGGKFKSSWSTVELKTREKTFWLTSRLFYGIQYPVVIRRVEIDNLFPTFDDPDFANRFYDKAGEEFAAIIQDSLDEIQGVIDGHIEMLGTNGQGMQSTVTMLNSEGGVDSESIYGVGSGTLRPEAELVGSSAIVPYDWNTIEDGSNELDSITVEKILDGGEIEFLLNECGLSCTALNFRRLKFTYKFVGTERLENSWAVFGGSYNFECGGAGNSPGGWLITNMRVYTPGHPNNSEYVEWSKTAIPTHRYPENFIADRHPEWIFGIGSMSNSDARGLLSELRNRKRASGPLYIWKDDPVNLRDLTNRRTILGYVYMWHRRASHGTELISAVGASGTLSITNPERIAAAESMTSPFWILDLYTSPVGIPVGVYKNGTGDAAVYLSVGVLTSETVVEGNYVFTRRYTRTAIGYEDGPPNYAATHAAIRAIQFSGRDVYIANRLWWGSAVTVTVEELPMEPTRTDLVKAEVSGFGYYPQGGFSFRKTHSRSIFKPCDFNKPSTIWDLDEAKEGMDGINIDKVLPGAGNGGSGVPNPPFSWDYPETIPLPPNYALFQTGTFAPYYPTYEEAIVLDTQLSKWGKYSNKHKAVYNLFPLNRTDQTIMPTEAGTMRAGALSPEGWCTLFTHENPASRITYGKIGDYRLGWTRATKAVAQFGYEANCYMIAEVSVDGDAVADYMSQATLVESSRRIELPFTLQGKWFNIRFEGTFNLVGLSLESEAKSRR